jgi:hypothetical protein
LHQLRIGDRVQFKHNFSRQVRLSYPFRDISTLTMVCVGVGVAPMVQSLHHLLLNAEDRTKVCWFVSSVLFNCDRETSFLFGAAATGGADLRKSQRFGYIAA